MNIRKGIDYYSVLGLTANATPIDIKNAYRTIALQSNLDRAENPNEVTQSELIGEAFEVLSNPLLRTLYDQFGEEGLKSGIRTPDSYIPPYAYHGDPSRTYKEFFGTASPFADVLQYYKNIYGLFDLARFKIEKKKQPTLVKPLELSLEEVFFGGTKKVKMNRRVFTGEEAGQTEIKEHIFSISIKPGLPAGTEITFLEAGDMNSSTIPGDIVFVTEDKPHPNFIRTGINLVTIMNISLHQALTGRMIEITTLDKRLIRANVTKVVTPDYEHIIQGEGMPHVENPQLKGDLIIKFNVEFPKYLPKTSKKIIVKALKGPGLVHPGSPEHINKLVIADKMRRLSCGALAPLGNK